MTDDGDDMTTDRLDQLMQKKRDRYERDRQQALQKVRVWLNQNGADYGIQEAFIFGSVTRPGHFHDNSDVDIAVVQIKPEKYCIAISFISEWLERDVDLIELPKCPFQHRIRELGIRWTAQPI